MATAYTPNTKLGKPAVADRYWNLPLNANADALDALATVGGLCVSPLEIPSASLKIQVAPGNFRSPDGTVASFAGSGSTTLAAGQTSSIYLTIGGVLTASTSGYPAAAHVRLATVITGSSSIQSLRDDRVCLSAVGPGALPFLPLAGGNLAEGANIGLGIATGTQLGTTTSQKLGFWGASPVPRPAAYTQVYTTSTHTLPAYAPIVETTAFNGIASGQSGTPYAQAADLNNLRLAYENLRLLTENVAQVLNALIDDLQAVGLVG